MREHEHTHDQLEEDVADLDTRCDLMETDIEELQDRVADLEARLDDLEQVLKKEVDPP